MKKLFLITVLTVLSMASMQAQLDDRVRTHTIVALDKAGCSDILNDWYTTYTVTQLLFNNSHLEGVNPLCRKGDLVSFVGFSIDPNQRDMSTYQFPIRVNGNYYSYVNNTGNSTKNQIQNNWEQFANYSNPSCGHSDLYSLVSVAKPYALNELKKDGVIDDKYLTNRTFLLLITDHHYNGSDFYDEVHTLSNAQNDRGLPVVDESKILPLCYEVEQEYFIKYISTRRLNYRGYVELYEFLPLQTYLNMNSVADYPQTITAKRMKGKKYRIDVDFSHNGNDHYDIKKLEFTFNNGFENDTSTVFKDPNSVSFSHVVDSRGRPDSISVRAWVRLNDGVYNTTVLTPSPEAPDHLGRKGLNITLPIVYEKHARIFGIPMADFMWPSWIEDQYTAAIVVQTIMLVLLPFFVLLLVWIFYRRNRYYSPNVEDITITHYKS